MRLALYLTSMAGVVHTEGRAILVRWRGEEELCYGRFIYGLLFSFLGQYWH